MCGFAGLLLVDGLTHEYGNILESMSSVIAHRGPDDSGHEWLGPCGLAHRRLSVIDLSSAGHQPMHNENSTVWIAYNGEVYNFRELRRDFGLDGKYTFRSYTDTEVLLHLYEELGDRFFEHLNGMYALAIWDMKENRLILARDPFGIKPLFYMEHDGNFWFASEIKSLLQAPGFSREPSPEALYHYLSYDYIPDTLTPFRGIHELAPGKILDVRPGRGLISEKSIFEMEYVIDPSIDENTAVEESARLLMSAVERRLISDVPVGVMLSGGMDSSALTMLMARIRGNGGFHTFSLAFEDPSFDESWAAETVAGSIGSDHHCIMVTPEKVASLLPGHLAHIDEPYADGSAIPTWLLADEASDFITVLLSGEGGDEVFAGYDTHTALKVRNWYRKAIPGFLRRAVIKPMVHMLPVSHKKLSFEFKAKRFTEGAEFGVSESHFFWRAVLSDDAKADVLSRDFLADDFPPSGDYFRQIYNRCHADDDLNRILCIDSSCHLPHDLMIKNDRMTMAHSIEARVPFTDMELFRFMAKVPVDCKLPGLRKKQILRKAMKGLLPDKILNKKKVGLEMPYSNWFRSNLMEFSRDVLTGSSALDSGLLNAAGIEVLWSEHQKMRHDHGRALWGLLNYMLWYDMYISSDDYISYINRPEKGRSG